MHISGQSTGVTGNQATVKRQPQYLFESRRRYFTKNHGLVYAGLADLAWLVGFSGWKMRQLIQRIPDIDPPYLLIDFLRNSILPNFYQLNGLPDKTREG